MNKAVAQTHSVFFSIMAGLTSQNSSERKPMLDEDEKKDIYNDNQHWQLQKYDSLHILAKSEYDNRLTDQERHDLNQLLRFYAKNKNNNNNNNNNAAAQSIVSSVNSNFDNETDQKIKMCPLLFSVSLICLSSFIFGYCTIQPTVLTNNNDKGAINHQLSKDISRYEKALTACSTLIGASIGSLSMYIYSSFTKITYNVSRKKILLRSNIPIIFGGIIAVQTLWIKSIWIAIIGFIIQGFGVGISSIIAPILISEIAPTKVRSVLTWVAQLSITFGMFISAIVSWQLIKFKYCWVVIVIISVIPAILQLLCCKYVSKSPRLLIADFYKDQTEQYVADDKGFQPDSLDLLKSFYIKSIDAEIVYNHIKKRLMYNKQVCIDEGNSLLAMSRGRAGRVSQDSQDVSFRRSIFIGIFVNALQQLTGVNVIFYNSQSIIDQGIKKEQKDQSVFIGLMAIYGANFLATAFCMLLVRSNKVSHSLLNFVGTSMMLTSVAFLAIIDETVESHESNCENNYQLIDKLSMVTLPFFVVGYAMSLGPFTWILVNELFPLCHRIKYSSLCVSVQWFCNAIIAWIVHTKWYQDVWDYFTNDENANDQNNNFDGAIAIYVMCCVTITFTIGFLACFMKETKGLPLEFAVRRHNPQIVGWQN